MISASPVTNADSLDYHLHIGKQIASDSNIPLSLNHLHSFIGNGEIIIAIGIFSWNRATKFNCAILWTYKCFGIIRSRKNKNDFTIYLLSCPLIIFFISSIKPQFFYCLDNFCIWIINKSRNIKKEILFKNIFFHSFYFV